MTKRELLEPLIDPLVGLAAAKIAGFIIAGLIVGWTLRGLFPAAPLGTDPEYWRTVMRRRRRQLRRSISE